ETAWALHSGYSVLASQRNGRSEILIVLRETPLTDGRFRHSWGRARHRFRSREGRPGEGPRPSHGESRGAIITSVTRDRINERQFNDCLAHRAAGIQKTIAEDREDRWTFLELWRHETGEGGR
ncbi:hypothetical protein X777_14636, partial [Ooceraea biroi]